MVADFFSAINFICSVLIRIVFEKPLQILILASQLSTCLYVQGFYSIT